MRLTPPPPLINARFGQLEKLSLIIGLAVTLCGAMVLYGWFMDIDSIKRLAPHFPSMNPMTACALIITGLALAQRYRGTDSNTVFNSHWSERTATIGLSAVLVFGLIVLAEHYLGWELGADQILFTGELTNTLTGRRSSTAPGTAICLAFASLALLLLDVTSKRGWRPSELIAIAMSLVSFFGIEQYLFGSGHRHSEEIFSSMALHSAIACSLLALGILFARPRVGLMSLTTSNYPGVALFPPLNLLLIGLLLLWGARVMRNAELNRLQSKGERDRFFDLSLDLICIANTDGRFLQVNGAFLTTLGYSEEELLARPFLDIVHPEDMQSTLEAMDRLDAGQKVTRFVNRYRCKDGSWRHLSWASSPLPKEGLIYASARDITDFLGVQEALNASIGDGVLSTDVNGKVTRINRMAESLTGWSENEAIGLPVEQVFCILNEATREPASVPIIASLSTGEVRELGNHTLLVSRDGKERPIADNCAPIRNRQGDIVGAVLTFRDVSRERRVARELHAARSNRPSYSHVVTRSISGRVR